MKNPAIEIIKYFDADEDPDCFGDYIAVAVVIDGKEVVRYGDYYHEKGDIAAEAFV